MDFSSKTVCRGYTLIEVVVALFVFLIIMTGLSQSFTQSIAAYRNAKAVQRDVENAQFVLNLMAKELRTSTIVDPSSGSLVSAQAVRFYDYSQSTCFEYTIASNQLLVARKGIATPSDPLVDCSGALSGAVPVARIGTAGGTLTGTFRVTPSDPTVGSKKVGKVTVSLEISEGPNHTVRIQTSASLRDYGYIGL